MHRAKLNGAIIGAIFATVWMVDAGLALQHAAKVLVIISGTLLGLLIITAAVRHKRAITGVDDGNQFALFKMRSYRLIVVAEFVAIAAGASIISHYAHNQGLITAWIAFVVGIHFIALARFSAVPYFYRVGAALIVIAAVSGVGYRVSDWSETTVGFACALPCAAVLYLASWISIVAAKKRLASFTIG